jgi:prevent-host-death family protein
MKRMHVSAFKARCLSVVKTIHATGEPIVVTKRGIPLVKVVPVTSPSDDFFGFMAGEFQIVGDIESPTVPLEDWEISKR